ncbi:MULTISPECIES: N-acetyl-gamma-glutamyl-phosphate reductase [unclassified Wenzhouxiangella]|uniref:N-acetyl-gamma-glutamyl-phosphate reductase n=1 Tax=unclassified Wenzhouxiangella TaxID=2613841 RepID=UPI000E32B845|nr:MULTISPECIES: N-acetyl-gamma-glutamyl-phosphate reductase [unclassified Wenzhouxiangella]RFF26932.1 N-acetyl-gamma-glutamyl-phosphate reductase [Wenzhouxiangella sp. 15181]RFP69445.1 N-acetyl-gamma-glutamyl-phosphate reductase [Wenzhouxiangella sp. 15190]
MHRLALIGGRGYTGSELLRLLAGHDEIELALATSDSQAGQPIADTVPEWPDSGQAFEALQPEGVHEVDAEVWVLALPNGQSQAWEDAIGQARPGAVILDLGADWRFDRHWTYGLTELSREALGSTQRIANPGCYATGGMFGLCPIRHSLAAPPVVFGVSGYSGAGKMPSPRNDPDRLKDNLIPYALAGHIHEQEISAHLRRPVRFHPHVAPFFRGISMTVSVMLTESMSAEDLLSMYWQQYGDEPLIRLSEEIPEIRDVAGTPNLIIGGFTVDERDSMRASFVVVLDNLLKGAASQALQNINLALGLDELAGIAETAR